ncbi:hypothetical protein TNCV_4290031 [Trichonephila clavipes]|nr:hypothetical protein TNCV_4290031 [Trichonephila clavipes]
MLVERSTTFQKIPEGFELANMVANDAKIVTNFVTKNDANLGLPPRSLNRHSNRLRLQLRETGRSTLPDRMLISRLAIHSISLEESILNLMAIRPESSTQELLLFTCESSDRLYSVQQKSLTPLLFSESMSFDSGKPSSLTASGCCS